MYKFKNKRLTAVAALLCAALLLTACGGETQKFSLNVYITAPYVSEEGAQAMEESMRAEFPHLNTDDAQMNFTLLSSGDPEADPMLFMASSASMTGEIASGEIDLLVCDIDTAKRNKDGVFYELKDLFTQDELEAVTLPFAQFEQIDDEGNGTGEFLPICAVDMSELEEMSAVSSSAMVMMIPLNAPNLEAAKEAFYAIATYSPDSR